MRMYDIIRKKRDNKALSYDELKFFIDGYVEGTIPDYQAAAFLMAAFIREMSKQETVMLTRCMMESGEQMDLSAIPGIKVDKHSTGGVGDKTSIVLAPLVAAAGIPVAKMSGRGLGHTGGTIDKLESIPGFKAELSMEDFIGNVKRTGVAITGQTGNIAPGDKKLYALRDVTATIDNISLIASSIMSKKLAAGADRILLDVKVGSGAFMKEEKEALDLAETMVAIGNSSGKRTIAVLSDMNQPLGMAIGNALEVREAIDTLKGEGPEDFYSLCRELAAAMFMLGEKAANMEEGREMADRLVSSGKAAEKFAEFVECQGGNPDVLEHPEKVLPKAEEQMLIKAQKSGYIASLDAESIGIAAMLLGAGRSKKEDRIDPAVGIVMQKKCGMPVKEGEAVAIMHYNKEDGLEQAVRLLEGAINVSEEQPPKPELIKRIIE
jgi:pyrimidine-nucleoside phosphorylase